MNTVNKDPKPDVTAGILQCTQIRITHINIYICVHTCTIRIDAHMHL